MDGSVQEVQKGPSVRTLPCVNTGTHTCFHLQIIVFLSLMPNPKISSKYKADVFRFEIRNVVFFWKKSAESGGSL